MDGSIALSRPGRRLATVLGWALAAAIMARMALSLPTEPVTTGDSAEYLALAANRPPLYGLALNAWLALRGSFAQLPLAQFLLLAGTLLGCAAELARLLRWPLLAFALVPLVLLRPVGYEIARWMMSESLFISCLLAGLSMHLRFVRSGRGANLVGAALCFALAAITRSTGMALLPLPLLAALLDRRRPLRGAAWQAGGCGMAMVLVLLAGMAVNNRVNHRFEIGSFSGIALLGKALLLVQPADKAVLPAAPAATLASAQQARKTMVRQPDLAAGLRAQLQSTQDLRYASFFPAAQQQWPAWASADWRERSTLGQALAITLIIAHPTAYGRLWLNDWLSLTLYPNYWPRWASTEDPDRDAYPACRIQQNCWALERYDLPLVAWLAPILISVGALLAGTALLLWLGWGVLRRRAEPPLVLCCGLMLVIHATLLLSAATEAGFARYAMPVHVMAVVVVLWLLDRVGRWLGDDAVGWLRQRPRSARVRRRATPVLAIFQ